MHLYELFIWQGEPLQIGLACLLIFILLWAFNKFYLSRRKRVVSHHLHVRDPSKGHRWTPTEFIRRPTYCSVCEEPFVTGSYCDTCLVCTHDECVGAADKRFACKALTLSPERTSMRHHFVKGNVPLCSACARCGRDCGGEPRLCDVRCVWCQRKWHEKCVLRGNVGLEECDLGVFASLIVPPYSIALKMSSDRAVAVAAGWRKGRQQRRRLVVDRVYPVATRRLWSPVLILSNPKSGEKAGDYLLSAFRSLLNPVQVRDSK